MRIWEVEHMRSGNWPAPGCSTGGRYIACNPTIFYGDNLQTNSPLVLFVVYYVNHVLPSDNQIHLDTIMANTGWNHAWEVMKEAYPGEVHHHLVKESD